MNILQKVFTVEPSRLISGAFYVSARHETTVKPEDEETCGYTVHSKKQAVTLAYCLNDAYDKEQTLRLLKEGFKRIKDTFIL